MKDLVFRTPPGRKAAPAKPRLAAPAPLPAELVWLTCGTRVLYSEPEDNLSAGIEVLSSEVESGLWGVAGTVAAPSDAALGQLAVEDPDLEGRPGGYWVWVRWDDESFTWEVWHQLVKIFEVGSGTTKT